MPDFRSSIKLNGVIVDNYNHPINRGTVFPASPGVNDLYYRVDLGELCEWDGSRWVGTPRDLPTVPLQAIPYSGAAGVSIAMAPVRTDKTILVTGVSFLVNVQTTNNASNYWTFALTQSNGTTTIQSGTTASNTAGTWYTTNYALTSVQNAYLHVRATAKTGTPGGLYLAASIRYRTIYT